MPKGNDISPNTESEKKNSEPTTVVADVIPFEKSKSVLLFSQSHA